MKKNKRLFDAWLEADALAGPQQSYRLARKLPQHLRTQGRTVAARADWAVAHTLFWMGRFTESRDLLAAVNLDALTPDADTDFNPRRLIPVQLAWALALLGDAESAVDHGQRALAWAQSQANSAQLTAIHAALAQLYCFLDAPEATLEYARHPSDMTVLLTYWAQSRLGEPIDEAAAQTALSRLRRQRPADEARAFSLYAQAQFHQSPEFALTQLDAALDLNARFGLHHWEARLLHMKSQSLDAAGQLTEASRFQRLAIDTAQRQGARLFLNDIAGIESRTQAGIPMEFAA